jgi:glycosyltransferase involved in cell wall biosynthesis
VVSEHLGVKLGGLPFDVIPNGVDLSMFYPMNQQLARHALGWPNGQKIVLFGAAPENRVKNFPLAEKVCRLSRYNPNLVTLNGVPHEKVAVYMNASDALLITSFREGSPNVLREALACRLPVLSVDVGDVAEQTRVLLGCRVVTSYEPKTLAKELDEMLSSHQRISGPITGLDQKDITRDVIEVYEEVLPNAR